MNTRSIIWQIALAIVLNCAARAQSSFGFRCYNPPYVDAPVFDAQGVPLAGTGYLGELYGGATSNSLAPLVVFGEGFRVIISPAAPGYFMSSSGFLSVPSVPPNGWAWLQVRAWEARLGPTYEEVAALGVGGYGESPLFYAQGGNPYDYKGLPKPLIGLQSFSLLPVIPEPSASALVLLGLPLLLWRRGSWK
jgi:hypothetical protein